MTEKIQHPPHYGGDSIYEVIKIAEALGLDQDGYLFNTFKYIARAGKKDGEDLLTDLEKAAFYLNRKIDNLKDPPNWEQHFGTESQKNKAT